jgi:hypothetical protein
MHALCRPKNRGGQGMRDHDVIADFDSKHVFSNQFSDAPAFTADAVFVKRCKRKVAWLPFCARLRILARASPRSGALRSLQLRTPVEYCTT